MRINTNMAAMNAWKAMSSNQANLQNSLERLSSGFRINKAADDAAGLAVSEKLQSQMRGMAMATRNTQDAVSMVQTAEGGASKVQDMLQRMRELAVQAGSDTLQDTDRAQLQEEFSSLNAEIDRTANSVQFNGRKLVNGESGSRAALDSGTGVTIASLGTLASDTFNTNATQYVKVAVTTLGKEQTITGSAAKNNAGTTVNYNATDSLATLFGADIVNTDTLTIGQTVDGSAKTATITLNATVRALNADDFAAYVNDQMEAAGMKATVARNGTVLKFESNIAATSGNLTITESIASAATLGFEAGTTVGASADLAVTVNWGATSGTATNLLASPANYTVKENTLTGVAGTRLEGISFTATATNGGTEAMFKLDATNISFQVGANSSETISTQFADLRGSILGVSSLSISNKSGATSAISTLDDAIKSVSGHRAKMGALQNRLENTISTLQTQSENITAADSRIRDVDMASEMATFTRFQVLSQASTAMLAQANQLPQQILSLLR